MRLRPITEDDADAVLALNAESEHLMSPLDRSGLNWMRAHAHRVDVVEVDESSAVAAFVVVFGSDAVYDSPNYRWFQQHYGREFLYLDRIAVDPGKRRAGIGGFVYDDVEAEAATHRRLALEVNAVPPNQPSLAFHSRRGYREVGRLELGNGNGKVNVMLVKDLPS
ncbi:MAG: GNAT family N-acetyltransferase [Propionibacteriales bacterium]|nr:GNAT family N-acetyltransferase [Propionibacteriales bacterium]